MSDTVTLIERWQQRAGEVKQETIALYLAMRDPRVPRQAKLLIWLILGYAFSPVDLIPDFIPVLGYLDDLILIPIGVTLAVRMIPDELMAEYRLQAKTAAAQPGLAGKMVAGLIILFWAGLLIFFAARLAELYHTVA